MFTRTFSFSGLISSIKFSIVELLMKWAVIYCVSYSCIKGTFDNKVVLIFK